MGTIVYASLLRLFLDEGDFTLEEIIEMASEKYGFDKEHARMEIRLNVNMLKRYAIKELPNGKLQRVGEFPNFFEKMVEGPESLPEGHWGRTNLKQKQFYIDLEERYGKTHRREESTETLIKDVLNEDIPF